MTEQLQYIRIHIRDGVGILGLNRPEALNAINSRMIDEILLAMESFEGSEEVKAIVIHGEGKAFTAGFDLKESAQNPSLSVGEWRRKMERYFDFIMCFWLCQKPTIAAVHGYCLGASFEIMVACDLAVVAEGTRMGLPEVKFGSSMVALLLPWATTPKFAKELMLTGATNLAPQRAMMMGLVNDVVPVESVFDRAFEFAAAIASASPSSVQLTKKAINQSFEAMGMRAALRASLDNSILIESDPGPERIKFNELRKSQGMKAAVAGWNPSGNGA